MQLSNAPAKLPLPFADTGAKNTIPETSQIGIVAGAASLPDGFPPLTRTPLAAGGVPPSGQDMNGILHKLSALLRWINAGGGFPFDSAFAGNANVGGYPKGARILRADGLGYWLNVADNNTADPEAAGAYSAGWRVDADVIGAADVAVTTADVTLTPAQYGYSVVSITGALTGNRNVILPVRGRWTVANNTTGAFSLTVKTAAGSGVAIAQGKTATVYGDGTNIARATTEAATPAQFDASSALASTEFVQRALGNFREDSGVIGDNVTLTAADAGKAYIVTNAAAIVTLPLLTSVAPGAAFTFVTDRVVAFTGNSGELIHNGTGQANTYNVFIGEALTIVAAGTVWYVVGHGYGAGSFATNGAGNGYQKLPSGLIIQWGNASIPAAPTAVTFPIAFPNNCRSVVMTCFDNFAGIGEVATLQGFNNANFTALVANGNNGGAIANSLQYIAIGN